MSLADRVSARRVRSGSRPTVAVFGRGFERRSWVGGYAAGLESARSLQCRRVSLVMMKPHTQHVMHRLPRMPAQPTLPYKRRRLTRRASVTVEEVDSSPASVQQPNPHASRRLLDPTKRKPRAGAKPGENPGEKLGNPDVDDLAAERRRLTEEKAARRLARKDARTPAAKDGDNGKAPPVSATASLPPNTKGPGTLWDPDTRGEPRRQLAAVSERTARPPLPPHPRQELERCSRFDKLRVLFNSLCRRHGVRKAPFGAFERWHFCWLLNCGGAGNDSLLPPIESAEAAGEMAHVLQDELVKHRVVKHLAEEISHRMNEAAHSAAEGLAAALDGQKVDDDSKREAHFAVSVEPNDRNLSIKCAGETLKINKEHYDKLKVLHGRHTPGASDRAFHCDLFSMLLRYKTIRGGGFQAALGAAVFDCLKDCFGAKMEGFASPLNCRYDTYCSAFVDTDSPFGSLGSFFAFAPERGSFQLNPPFVPEVISGLAAHCEKLLRVAAENDELLAFTIIVGANEAARRDKAWTSLEEGRFSRRHEAEIVPIEAHGYLSGEQHLKNGRRLLSTCDSAVFFWQSPAAAAQWPVHDDTVQQLRDSFIDTRPEKRGGLKVTPKQKRPLDPESPSADAQPPTKKLSKAAARAAKYGKQFFERDRSLAKERYSAAVGRGGRGGRGRGRGRGRARGRGGPAGRGGPRAATE